MSVSRLFRLARKFRLHTVSVQIRELRINAFQLLSTIVVFGVLTGCGGSAQRTTTGGFSGTVAFVSNRAIDGRPVDAENIWVGNADGSGARPVTKLTHVGITVNNLAWSPDGSKIAFISTQALDGSDAANTDPNTYNLWVINADGSNAMPLTRLTIRNGSLGVLHFAWSPDGRRIAFSSNLALDGSDGVSASGTINMWVANSDGTGSAPITRFNVVDVDTPVWSPDGSRIAFASNGPLDGTDAFFNVDNIWVMKADGSGVTPVTRFAMASSLLPSFSPDGAKLAFVSYRGLDGSDVSSGPGNIWVANSDGSGAFPLTKYTAQSVSSFYGGFWSPDGKKFLFDSTAAVDGSGGLNLNSTENVWIANTDGSGAIPLTRLAYTTPAVGALPSGWSPDGANIGFSSDAMLGSNNTPGGANTWIMKADGSSSMLLTNAEGNLPAWKP